MATASRQPAEVSLLREDLATLVQSLKLGPEPEPVTPDDTASETLRACWKALELLEPRRRLALVLRHVEGMSLEEGAQTLAVSLATFKRLLAKAEADFRGLRPRFPALRDWFEEGSS